jgi:hypothetical protein
MNIRECPIGHDYFGSQPCPICELGKEIDRLRAERDSLELLATNRMNRVNDLNYKLALSNKALEKAQKYIVLNYDGTPDWACKKCRPNSDLLIEGFMCAYHVAEEALKGGE